MVAAITTEEYCIEAASSHIVNVKCESIEKDTSPCTDLKKSFWASDDANVKSDHDTPEREEDSADAMSPHFVCTKYEPIENDTSPYTELKDFFTHSEDINAQRDQNIPEKKEDSAVVPSPHFVCVKCESNAEETSQYTDLNGSLPDWKKQNISCDQNPLEMEENHIVVLSPHFVDVKRETNDEDSFQYTEVKDVILYSQVFPVQNYKLPCTEWSEWSCSSQIASSSTQSPSVEMTAMKSQNQISKTCSVVSYRLEYQKRFSAASCSTTQEDTAIYLPEGHGDQKTPGERQMAHSYQSEDRSSAGQEEDRSQRATFGSDSLRISKDNRCFKCSHCGKDFNRKENLNTHIRIHTGHRPYKCSKCGKSFIQSGALTAHMRKHTGDKPYKCSECRNSFADGSALRKHNLIHTGEKPYRCSQCGDSFARSGTLTKHIRLHTGEKPYRCSQCGKSFSDCSALRRHIRLHTGEKPYKCSQCGKSFAQSSTLTTHMHTHTRDRPNN